MKRASQKLLTVLFLLTIGAVPVTQAILDITVNEEPRPYVLTLFTRTPSEKNLRDFEDNLEQSSNLEQAVRPRFQLGRYQLLRDLGEKALRGDAPGWYFYTPGVRYLVEPFYRDLPQPPPHDPVQVIRDFARQLERRGIEVLVLPVPGKASIHPERLVAGVKPSPAIAAHTERVRRELRQQGVRVLDLHRVLLGARARQPDQVLYMRADTHWNGLGARLAAEAVAGWVQQRPWFAKLPKTTRYARKPIKVERRGDVPRMTRIPEQERLFPAETVTCYQVRFAGGESRGELYEEPDEAKDAPILVLGDSFSRVFQFDEPEAAGWIANLAFALQTPVAALVNDGGASTLVRQELARDLSVLAGKRLVIWAFVERDIRFGMQGWQPIQLWEKDATPTRVAGGDSGGKKASVAR